MAEMNAVANAPIMPHLDHTAEELDKAYPAIEVGPEVDDEVIDNDPTLEAGLKTASEIVQQSNEYGRRRIHDAQWPSTIAST